MRTRVSRRVTTVVATLATVAGLLTGFAANASASPGLSIAPASAGSSITGPTLAVGDGAACAIRTGGTISCWGGGFESPGLLNPPSGHFLQLSMTDGEFGMGEACALAVDGTVTCWGGNREIGSPPPTTLFSSISVGGEYACGITSTGTLSCWGDFPGLPQAGSTTFRTVSVGAQNACAVGTDGTLTCWGDASSVQEDTPPGTFKDVSVSDEGACALGDDSTVTCFGSNVRNPLPGETFREIGVNDSDECGIETDGTTICWGNNASETTPDADAQIVQLAVGPDSTCGVLASGQVQCWGPEAPEPVPALNFGHPTLDGSSGGSGYCGVRTDSIVTCIGQSTPPTSTALEVSVGYNDTDCDLGFDGTATCNGVNGAPPPVGVTYTQIAAGLNFACGLEVNGSVTCWGFGGPVGETTSPDTFVQISVGGGSVCGITSAGSAQCFGFLSSQTTPSALFRQVTLGLNAACGIAADESAVCWGLYGDDAPPPASSFRQISLGSKTACGVTAESAVECWGDDTDGLVGAAPLDSDFVSVSTSEGAACALRIDGTTTCWGDASPAELPDLIAPPFTQTITFSTPPASPAFGDSGYSVTATADSGNPVVLTIDSDSTDNCSLGSSDLVTYQHAGTCTIDASVDGNDDDAAATGTQMLEVGKGTQAITFSSTPPQNPAFGSTYTPTATGGDSGNPVTFSVPASSTGFCTINEAGVVTFSHAGSCEIDANQAGSSDYDDAPQIDQIVPVGKGTQAITFTSTAPTSPAFGSTYTPAATGGGSGNPVEFTIDEASSDVCSIDNSGVVTFKSAGSCEIDANQAGNLDYTDASQIDQTIDVPKAPQVITFTSKTPKHAMVGQTYYPMALGGGSDNPVEFTADASGSACTVDEGVVSFVGAGTCVIDANQDSDSDYAAATQAQQTFNVALVGSTVSVVVTPASSIYGQTVSATATVTTQTGTPDGTVQFSTNGNDIGSPVQVSAGTATIQLLDSQNQPLAHGSYDVHATFTPTDPATYASSNGAADAHVSKDETVTSLTLLQHQLQASVSALAPGAGSPSGVVTFYDGNDVRLGQAPIVDGVAKLSVTLSRQGLTQVSAQYSGDLNFLPSVASNSRYNPTITAAVTSASPRSSYGWYRTPVTVIFTCAPDGAPLAGPCPAPVTLSHSVAGRSVTRAIRATDGGVGVVTVNDLNIDLHAPHVRVGGVRNHARYGGAAPAVRCVGHDALSGIASCTVQERAISHHRTRYRLVATDEAGNTRTRTGSFHVARYYFDGLTMRNGAYMVRAGHTYDLIALTAGSRAPQYYDAEPAPGKAYLSYGYLKRAGTDSAHKRWALGVTITHAMLVHRFWNVGLKIGHTFHTIRIRVIS